MYKYYLNVMVASFWGGGANVRACARDSSALCSNDESSHISEKKIAMQLNRVANQLRYCVAKLLRNF